MKNSTYLTTLLSLFIGVYFIAGFVAGAGVPADEAAIIVGISFLVMTVAQTWVTFVRAGTVGASRWWALGINIPIANMVTIARLAGPLIKGDAWYNDGLSMSTAINNGRRMSKPMATFR